MLVASRAGFICLPKRRNRLMALSIDWAKVALIEFPLKIGQVEDWKQPTLELVIHPAAHHGGSLKSLAPLLISWGRLLRYCWLVPMWPLYGTLPLLPEGGSVAKSNPSILLICRQNNGNFKVWSLPGHHKAMAKALVVRLCWPWWEATSSSVCGATRLLITLEIFWWLTSNFAD